MRGSAKEELKVKLLREAVQTRRDVPSLGSVKRDVVSRGVELKRI